MNNTAAINAPNTSPRWSSAALWIAASCAMLAVIIISLGIGRYDVPWTHITAILLQPVADLGVHYDEAQATVVAMLRLPRALTAAFAGAGLAITGAALQGVFRNPLVGPQIIGVSSGAGFGGALAITLSAGGAGIVAGSFVFGFIALLAVVLLARIDGRAPTLMLVLAGVIIGALFSALTSLLVFIADPDVKLPGIVFWLLGSFATAEYQKLAIVGTTSTTGAAVLLALRWRINLLSLGDRDAVSLGIRIEPVRWIILTACCLIVAGQVAVSGVIGWVGLIIPHIARMIVGADHRRLLPASLLLGAGYMVLIDTTARGVSAAEIPLGILTALIGVPVFALMLRIMQRKGWSDD